MNAQPAAPNTRTHRSRTPGRPIARQLRKARSAAGSERRAQDDVTRIFTIITREIGPNAPPL